MNSSEIPEVSEELLRKCQHQFQGRVPSIKHPSPMEEMYRRQGEKRVLDKLEEWHRHHNDKTDRTLKLF